jgi:hypothetical protein
VRRGERERFRKDNLGRCGVHGNACWSAMRLGRMKMEGSAGSRGRKLVDRSMGGPASFFNRRGGRSRNIAFEVGARRRLGGSEVERLVPQAAGLSGAESALGTTRSTSEASSAVRRDEDVRRLGVSMDDPFLVRVLHRVAELDEQIEEGVRGGILLVATPCHRDAPWRAGRSAASAAAATCWQ